MHNLLIEGFARRKRSIARSDWPRKIVRGFQQRAIFIMDHFDDLYPAGRRTAASFFGSSLSPGNWKIFDNRRFRIQMIARDRDRGIQCRVMVIA